MNQKLTLSLLGLTLAVVATLAIAPIVSEMAYATQIARGGNGGIGGAGGAGGNGVNGGNTGGGLPDRQTLTNSVWHNLCSHVSQLSTNSHCEVTSGGGAGGSSATQTANGGTGG